MLVAKGGPCAALLASPCAKGRHAVEFEVVLPGTIGCSFGMAAASAQFDAPPGERAQTIGLRQDGSVCRDGETAQGGGMSDVPLGGGLALTRCSRKFCGKIDVVDKLPF